jgi:hypothetical protein
LGPAFRSSGRPTPPQNNRPFIFFTTKTKNETTEKRNDTEKKQEQEQEQEQEQKQEFKFPLSNFIFVHLNVPFKVPWLQGTLKVPW